MRCRWTLSAITITPAPAAYRGGGLVAFVAATLGGSIGLDGLSIRLSRVGRLYVAFPRRRRRSGGRERFFVRPLDRRTAAHLESQILAAFHMEEASR